MTPNKENCCYSNWNVFTAFRSHGNQRIDESVKTTRKMADVNKRWCKDNTGWKNFQYARGQLNSGENIKKEKERKTFGKKTTTYRNGFECHLLFPCRRQPPPLLCRRSQGVDDDGSCRMLRWLDTARGGAAAEANYRRHIHNNKRVK